jgi:hypothetical protein
LKQNSGPGFKSAARQLTEITELVLRGHLHPSEYFAYGLSRREVTKSDMAVYLGNHTHWHESLPRLNQQDWRKLTQNKWFFQLHFQEIAPMPKVYGLYHPVHGITSDGVPLTSATELSRLLADRECSGFVAKPVEGWKGEGVTVIREIQDGGRRCLAQDGTSMSLDDLAAGFVAVGTGVIIQERLVQSGEMSRIARDGSHTLRIVTMVGVDGRVYIPTVTIKMGTVGMMVDNAVLGASVALVDVAAGVLGPGMTRRKDRSPGIGHWNLDEHFTGKVVPGWRGIIEMVERLAAAAPGLRAIGWDIMVTDDGPRVIEGNDDWDVVGQQARGRRFLQPRMVEILREAGVDVYAPDLPPVRLSKVPQVLGFNRRHNH